MLRSILLVCAVFWIHHSVVNGAGYPGTCETGGYTPTQVKNYYGMDSSLTAGAGRTLAIVGCGYDNNVEAIESDLTGFSVKYGLPNCTLASGCLRVVNTTGGSTFAPIVNNSGCASGELAMDIQWAHAIAPGANILVIMFPTSTRPNIHAAFQYAQTQTKWASTSWGYRVPLQTGSFYIAPNFSVFVPSGDAGTVASKSNATNVIIVGGTEFNKTVYGGPITAESGWLGGSGGSGGGCLTDDLLAPSAQTGFSEFASVGCGIWRGVPDLAMNALCVMRYCAFCNPTTPLGISGGTSLSTPTVAAYALTQNVVVTLDMIYSASSPMVFKDITRGGSSTNDCKIGYDLVTGRGVWVNTQATTTTAAATTATTAAATTATTAAATTATTAAATTATTAAATTATTAAATTATTAAATTATTAATTTAAATTATATTTGSPSPPIYFLYSTALQNGWTTYLYNPSSVSLSATYMSQTCLSVPLSTYSSAPDTSYIYFRHNPAVSNTWTYLQFYAASSATVTLDAGFNGHTFAATTLTTSWTFYNISFSSLHAPSTLGNPDYVTFWNCLTGSTAITLYVYNLAFV